MRLVQISVPDDRRESVVEVIQDRDLGYTLTEEDGDHEDRSLIQFAVPADAIEHVLEDLHEAGLGEEEYTVSIDVEFAIFEHADEVQNKWANTPNRIAPRTLRAKAKDLRLNTRSYVWMMFLSTVIAAAGLLLSSPAIVVGSMVLAPIVSPMLTASVGAVRNDRDMLITSVHLQLFGLLVGVVGALLLSLALRWTGVVPATLRLELIQIIGSRASPGILTTIVGLAAGAAGAFGLATKGNVSIVGVMISAALIPTAAVSGLGLAWGNVVLATGALLLLVVTIIAVNAGGFLMLLYLGYRPDEADESLLTVDSGRRAAIVVGTALLVIAIVAVSGAAFYQQSSFEHTVNDAATDVLSEEQYGNLGITTVRIEYTAPGPLSEPVTVTFVLSRTADEQFPDLPDRLDRRITDRTGREVVVQVQYVDFDRSEPAAGS